VGTQEDSGIKGSMYKAMKSFICRGCLNPVTGTGRASVDIGASANLEVVDKFLYLGDMLSVGGDADAVWMQGFKLDGKIQAFGTNEDISLIMREGCCIVNYSVTSNKG